MSRRGQMILGTEILDRRRHEAQVYISEDGQAWGRMMCWRKRRPPLGFFGTGRVGFIRGQPGLDDLYVSIRGLRDRTTYRLTAHPS